MENDFLTEEKYAIEGQTETSNQTQYEEVENEYFENGFKKYINKYKNSPLFWPLIILLLIILVGVIIFSIVINSTGNLKAAKVTAPSVIYLGENETISAESIGSGNLRKTSFHYDISNSSIVELMSKAGKTGKKTTNELIPITTGKFLLYVDAELKDNKIERIEKEIVICKAFSKQALQREKITLIKGKSHTVHLDLGIEECYEGIEYEIEDEAIATVEEGKVTGLETGETKLIIYKDKKEIELLVKIIDSENEQNVTGLTVDKESITIEIGSTTKINATIEPKNATNQTIIWTTSNESVATVSNKGVIKGIGKGTAKITAMTQEGEYKKEIIVIVKDIEKTTKPSTNKEVKVTAVKINKSKTSVLVGKSEQLIATVYPNNATNKKVKWTTSDKNIVEVTQNGLITGKKAGTAKITATADEKKSTITVKVSTNKVEVTSIKISPSTKTINVGETVTLTATIKPDNATNQNVKWTTSNSAVATVKNGIVRGVSGGIAKITAVTENGKKSESTITVKAQDTNKPIITVVNISSNNTNKNIATIGDTITLKMTFNENLSNKPSVEIAGSVASVTGSGKIFNATYKVTEKTSIGKVRIKIYNYKDQANNTGEIVTKTTDNSSVEIKTKQTQFTVKYLPNGGTGTMANQQITYGTSTALRSNTFKKTGYTFIGWVVQRANGKRLGCTEGTTCPSTAKTHTWHEDSKIKTYYIYRDKQNVSKTSPAGETAQMIAQWGRVINGGVAYPNINTARVTIKMNLPGKTQWSIYTQSTTNGNKQKTTAKNIFAPNSNTILKTIDITRTGQNKTIYVRACMDEQPSICTNAVAITITGNQFTLKFHPNSGTGTMADQKITYGQTTAINTNKFTRNGYTFAGWVAKNVSDNTRLGCTEEKVCQPSSKTYGWHKDSQIKSYYIYKDKQNISQTVKAGQTAQMIALWAKLNSAKKSCSTNSCNIEWSITNTIKTSWDLYYNGIKSTSSKNIISSAKNTHTGKMTDFIRGTSEKTIKVKACLTSNPNVCTNIINVTIPKKESTSNKPESNDIVTKPESNNTPPKTSIFCESESSTMWKPYNGLLWDGWYYGSLEECENDIKGKYCCQDSSYEWVEMKKGVQCIPGIWERGECESLQ